MKYLCLLFTIISFNTQAQEYAYNLIPDSLKENADVVLRKEELVVEITDFDKAIIKHKYAITILNEYGDSYAKYQAQYDKLRSLSDINGTLYDANGLKIKSAKRKDIYDVSAVGDNFISDERVKIFSFKTNTYPYTVEFEDEQTLNGIYHLPSWHPVSNIKFAVQQSSFAVETFLDYGLRFQQINFIDKPIISREKKVKYYWEIKNTKALQYESLMPNWNDIAPMVLIAPSKFSIEGYTGDMTTWKGLGNFSLLLNKNRDILPESIKKTVHELTDSITNIEKKVEILYNYLQQNTRYISIQLGIGGWQPLDAKFVSEKKYGDCKALSNFMVTLLKEAKIPAYYTIIKSGENVGNGLNESFPISNFNHIITCVPMQKDTLWLECTSQTACAGYTGSSISNRKALLISDSGGVVVSTPVLTANDNKSIRNVIITIDEYGDAIINSKTLLTGTKQDVAHSILYHANEAEKTSYLNRILGISTYTVEANSYKEKKGRIPEMTETLKITAQAFASITGKRMFITPNLFNRISEIESEKPRQYNIVYKSSFKEIDSIEILIPQGYKLELMPKNINLNNSYFKYQINYSLKQNTIQYYRYYEQNTNCFSPKEFNTFISYYNEMYKADKSRIVFVKQQM